MFLQDPVNLLEAACPSAVRCSTATGGMAASLPVGSSLRPLRSQALYRPFVQVLGVLLPKDAGFTPSLFPLAL